ncbi:MAG: response regulator [Phyllobacteriaceae bacterium]|nr:response regulator [Phyllobacteriaceae bacterium]
MSGSVRVLVVEDQPLIAMDLEDLLVSRGYAVLGPKATVAEALDCLARVTPEAALLDIDLAGETSFAVASELGRRGVPFVFATGTAGADARIPDDLLDTPVIQKPWNVDDVLSFLREHALPDR